MLAAFFFMVATVISGEERVALLFLFAAMALCAAALTVRNL